MMVKTGYKYIALLGLTLLLSSWGFYAHQRINYMAVFTLPPQMIGFYKGNIQFLTEAAVNPDKRRFVVKEEATRHYIDIDHFGDSAIYTMPRYWNAAITCYPEDTLLQYGVLPWHIYTTYFRLRDAFMAGDPESILRLSADLGHYIADAHVPLHTTENHNGQLTGQEGIHAFWESRLPELFDRQYDFYVGKASYLENPQLAIWNAIVHAHLQVDDVLRIERELTDEWGDRKFSFETKGKQTQRVYALDFSKAYHEKLNGMVERQMQSAIKLIGDFWYTAWVEAGQPDLNRFKDYRPTQEEIKIRKQRIKELRNSDHIEE